MTIDLNTCKPGDKLRINADPDGPIGDIVTYVRKLEYDHVYDHQIMYADGLKGARTQGGLFSVEPIAPDEPAISDTLYDVIEIIGQ